jgi:hypothetical protein
MDACQPVHGVSDGCPEVSVGCPDGRPGRFGNGRENNPFHSVKRFNRKK